MTPSPNSWKRSGNQCPKSSSASAFERAVDFQRIVMEVEMAHNLHRDYEKVGDKLSAALRKVIERGRTYPAVDYLRARSAIAPLNEALEEAVQRIRRHPYTGGTGRGARDRHHRRPDFLFDLDLSRDAGRDPAAPELRGRFADRRAAGRPPRERRAPLAHGALACQNIAAGRAPPASQGTRRTAQR